MLDPRTRASPELPVRASALVSRTLSPAPLVPLLTCAIHREWIKSNGSFHVHSSSISSTSNVQLPGALDIPHASVRRRGSRPGNGQRKLSGGFSSHADPRNLPSRLYRAQVHADNLDVGMFTKENCMLALPPLCAAGCRLRKLGWTYSAMSMAQIPVPVPRSRILLTL